MRSDLQFRALIAACGLAASLVLAGSALAGAPAAKLQPQDLTARSWGKSSGLPDNSVTAVLQTRDGYLWVGTERGLARFDGSRFQTMPPQTPLSRPLCVTAFCEDADGRLWVGTRGDGLLCREGGVLRTIATGDMVLENITGLAADNEANLWVSTPSGLVRYKDGKLDRLTVRDGLPSDSVSSVYVAHSGTVWITTRGGVCLYKKGSFDQATFQPEGQGRSPEFLGVYEDQQRGLWAFGDTFLVNLAEGKRFNYFRGGDTSSARIWSICEGRNGRLWVGTSGEGLYCFANGRFAPVTLREGRLPTDVRAICEDTEGNLWLGAADGGLVRLQPRGTRFVEPNVGLPEHAGATCLATSSDGKLWLGFEHGGVYRGAADHFEAVPGLESLNLITSIALGQAGGAWIGASAGLYHYKDGQLFHLTTAHGLSDDQILSVCVDSKNVVWAGTRAGSLNQVSGRDVRVFGTECGLNGAGISALYPAHSGTLWVGTENGALLRGADNQFQRVSTGLDSPGAAIYAVHEDANGRLWFGGIGSGLSCLANGRRVNWDSERGLPDNDVLGITTDGQGGLWLQTARAIVRIPPASIPAMLAGHPIMHARTLFEFDPTTASTPLAGSPRAASLSDERLWFATPAGVVVADPHGVDAAPPPPQIRIEEITVNDRALHGTRFAAPQKLPHNLRSLDIHFTAPCLSEPEKVRFSHRLDNIDSDWVDGGIDRHVRYGRLPYGTYRFLVKASHSEGLWAESEIGFDFTVPTPFWRTWWAMSLYGMVVTTGVAGGVRWISHRRLRARLAQSRAQEAMERERVRIAQDMHDEIGSKLTKISFLSERARREIQEHPPVAQKLDAIATTSREVLRSLDEIVWAVNPRNDSLERLAAYLGQYAEEYLQNTPVGCQVRLPSELPKLPLSAEVRHNLFLAFEESLTNALKHAAPTLVQVNMTVEAARFQVTIQDDGRGFDLDAVSREKAPASGQAPSRRGNGLHNLKQRLATIGGTCEITSRPGSGTTVILTIPLPEPRKS